MITFLTYTDFSLVQAYFANKQGLSLLNLLLGNEKLKINRKTIDNWSMLRSILNPEADLFADNSDVYNSNKIFLIDYSKLELDENSIQFLSTLSEQVEVYFYSFADNSDKNLTLHKDQIKKLKFNLLKLSKTDSSVSQSLVREYIQYLEAKDPLTKIADHAKNLLDICNQAQNYFEIINNLDLVYLAPTLTEQTAVIKQLVKKVEPLPFMLSFRLDNLEKDVQRWYNLITENEVQLGLSLILTKLEKQTPSGRQKFLIHQLILTDKKIKNLSPSFIWWKFFLWQAKSISKI